jgi:amino acid adenylation domain-containing protein/thioester reductase-like protein
MDFSAVSTASGTGAAFRRRSPTSSANDRCDTHFICRRAGHFATQTADDAEGPAPLLVAAVACLLGLYRECDRIRIGVSLPPTPRGLRKSPVLIDLQVLPEARFNELTAIAARALQARPPVMVDGDQSVDAIVEWRECAQVPEIARCNIAPDHGGLLFEFILSPDTLRLAIHSTGSAAQRIFPQVIADVMAELFQSVFEDPATPTAALRFVSAAWRHRLLTGFNTQPIPYRRDRTILHLFEDCAVRLAHRPAVTCANHELTYGELNGKANALAARLHEIGVRKGDLIPVVTDGGIELPIAMIALMKLGAAFVPVDVAWPDERLRVIFNELAPKLALYNKLARVVGGVPRLRIAVEALDPRNFKPLDVDILPEDLIYGFFTSGTTGTPKCTLNLHGGLLNRFLAMSRRFGADADEVVLQNSRHVFDSSIWQLLWPLTKGGRVVIPSGSNLLDLPHTISLIERHAVTMTDFVPSIFGALVELIDADAQLVPCLRSLRHLLIGGEEIGPRSVQKFRGVLPDCAITNTYGPTEASIGCIFHQVSDEDGLTIPIGRPIDNCYATIVNARGLPVPPGAIGEILIGGDCLGRGYLNDQAKTDAAFIANPFIEIPGARLYRTGDLGYHRPDGNILFVGRRDQQVKLGGIRIEPEEIEMVIAARQAVRAVKVLVEGERDESTRLVAYVVAPAEFEPNDIKRAVADSLPAYCVPKQVIIMDRMPLTANGKIDRKALSAMARYQGTAVHETVSDTERRIRSIWLESLSLGRVGLHDHFLECGGDSLVAVKLALRLGKEFARNVAARDIYRFATISSQAEWVEGRHESGASTQPTPTGPTLETSLRSAACLDAALEVGPGAVADSPGLVLLTGATGFVGSHLLRSILSDTQANLICLVRGESDAAAVARLQMTLRHYRLEDERWAGRVTAVAGNLESPCFGLPVDVYDRLAGSVDAVVHNGAQVNFLLGFAALRAANVSGTNEIIRFTARCRPKRLHYISTLAAVVADAAAYAETELSADARFPDGGYGQSKSVAERLVAQARGRGLAAITYRLGEVMPHSNTGVANARALLDTLIRSCLKLGLSFATSLRLDYTPVDYVARFLSAAIAAPTPPTSVFHVFHPQPRALATIFESFRQAGFQLQCVSYREFHRALREAAAAAAADPDLLLTLALMPEPHNTDHDENDATLTQLVGDAGQRFSCTCTLAAIDRMGISWPSPGPAVLAAYAAYHRDQFQRAAAATRRFLQP